MEEFFPSAAESKTTGVQKAGASTFVSFHVCSPHTFDLELDAVSGRGFGIDSLESSNCSCLIVVLASWSPSPVVVSTKYHEI
jgi:hypothetical protein